MHSNNKTRFSPVCAQSWHPSDDDASTSSSITEPSADLETDGVWIENVKREPDDVIVTDYEIRKDASVNALTDFGRVYKN